MIGNGKMEIVKHKEIAHNIFEMTVIGQQVAQMKSPGQFVHIRVSDHSEPLLRRPISIASIDRETLEFTMIYRVDGRGTHLLSEKRSGDTIDVLGPLGNGFPVAASEKGQHAWLIGGGIGVPPLYELAKQLTAKGVTVTMILGFQSAQDVFYEEAFQELGETFITTVDGTHGTQGFVTTKMSELPKPDIYYSCGPKPMLHAVEQALDGIPGYLSFEQRMGCGIGACFACVCPTTEGDGAYVKVCSDGPVFQAGVIA